MTKRTVTATITFVMRDMTQDEYAEASWGLDEEDDIGPEGWVDGVSDFDLREVLADCLNTETNPETLAGSNLFVHFEEAQILSVEVSPPAPPPEPSDHQMGEVS